MLLDTASVPVVTIDGPSGSGKGAVGRQLAKKLHWHFLDSGAIYRAFAFMAIETATPTVVEALLLPLSEQLEGLRFISDPANDVFKIFYKQRDITAKIRTEKMGCLASQLSVYPTVRNALLSYQRAFRVQPGLVADGRDMGTIVFPDAQLKIFLFATLEERAKRRYLQLKTTGKRVSLDSVRTELEHRDTRDEKRSTAPLKASQDALVIDTTYLSIQNVLRCILDKLGIC